MCEDQHISSYRIISGPSGAPIFTYARNLSATSIEVAWEPPPNDTINGEFTGYLLKYWRAQPGQRLGLVKEVPLHDDTLKVSRRVHCRQEGRSGLGLVTSGILFRATEDRSNHTRTSDTARMGIKRACHRTRQLSNYLIFAEQLSTLTIKYAATGSLEPLLRYSIIPASLHHMPLTLQFAQFQESHCQDFKESHNKMTEL